MSYIFKNTQSIFADFMVLARCAPDLVFTGGKEAIENFHGISSQAAVRAPWTPRVLIWQDRLGWYIKRDPLKSDIFHSSHGIHGIYRWHTMYLFYYLSTISLLYIYCIYIYTFIWYIQHHSFCIHTLLHIEYLDMFISNRQIYSSPFTGPNEWSLTKCMMWWSDLWPHSPT